MSKSSFKFTVYVAGRDQPIEVVANTWHVPNTNALELYQGDNAVFRSMYVRAWKAEALL